MPTDSTLRIFLSYSRKDLPFPVRLSEALVAAGYEVAIDLEDIAKGENWRNRLDALILESDVVVFVMTDHSLASQVCAREVERAVELGKRIAPLVHGPLTGKPPAELAALNWTFSDEPGEEASGDSRGTTRPESPSEAAVEALRQNIDHDISWIREHTRWTARAADWESDGRPKSKLLRRGEAAAAREWLKLKPGNSPSIPESLNAFLETSEYYETSQRNQLLTLTAKGFVAPAERSLAAGQFEAAIKYIAAGCLLGEDPELERVPSFRPLLARSVYHSPYIGRLTQVKQFVFIDAGHVFYIDTEDRVYCLDTKTWTSRTLNGEHKIFSDLDTPYSILFGSKQVAFVNQQKKVVLADISAGTSRMPELPVNVVRGVVLLPNAILAVLLENHSVALIDPESGNEMVRIPEPYLPEVRRIQSSRDGSVLMTESSAVEEHPVTIWNTQTGEPVAEVADVSNAQLSPDGTMVAAEDVYESFSTIEKVATGEQFTLSHEKGVFAPRFSPCGNWVATRSLDDVARIWNCENGDLLHEFGHPSGELTSIAFSDDGNTLVTGGDDGSLIFRQISSRRVLNEINNPLAGVESFSISPGGRAFGYRSLTGEVRLFEPNDDAPVSILGDLKQPSLCGLSESGERFFRVCENRIEIYATDSGEIVNEKDWPTGTPVHANFSPGDEVLAILDREAKLSLLALSGEKTTTAKVPWQVTAGDTLHFSPNGRFLVHCAETGQFVIYSSPDLRILFSASSESDSKARAPAAVCFSPDSERCILGSPSPPVSGIYVLNIEKWTCSEQLVLPDRNIHALVHLPERNLVIFTLGSEDVSLLAWEVGTEVISEISSGPNHPTPQLLAVEGGSAVVAIDLSGATWKIDLDNLRAGKLDQLDSRIVSAVESGTRGQAFVLASQFSQSYGEDWITRGSNEIRLIDLDRSCCINSWTLAEAEFSAMALRRSDQRLLATTNLGGLVYLDPVRAKLLQHSDSELMLKSLDRGRGQLTGREKADLLLSEAPGDLHQALSDWLSEGGSRE